MPGCIDHAAEHFPADRRTLGARHRIVDRRAFQRIRARQEAAGFRGRHQAACRREADDFSFGGRDRAAGRQFDHAFGADAHLQPDGFQHEAGGAREAAARAHRLGDGAARFQRVELRAPCIEMRIAGQMRQFGDGARGMLFRRRLGVRFLGGERPERRAREFEFQLGQTVDRTALVGRMACRRGCAAPIDKRWMD